jgi:hypothetical protein
VFLGIWDLAFWGFPSGRGSSEAPQVLERVKAGAVAITPARLEGIPSDILPADELKARVGVTHVGPLDVPQHIGLAAAGSTGAGAAETLKGKIGFFAIVPLHCEFGADELDIFWLKSHGRQSVIRVDTTSIIAVPEIPNPKSQIPSNDSRGAKFKIPNVGATYGLWKLGNLGIP